MYGNGSWAYDGPIGSVDGKLAPPHSKTWINRLLKRGVSLDFAKMDWADYYTLRHGCK